MGQLDISLEDHPQPDDPTLRMWIKELANGDPKVSMAACARLAEVKDPRIVPWLLHEFPEPERVGRRRKAGMSEEQARRLDLLRAAEKIAGKPALDICGDFLRHPAGKLRLLAVDMFAKLDGDEALAQLVKAATHPEPGLRLRALDWLRAMKNEPRAVAAMAHAMADPEPRVRSQALDAAAKEFYDPASPAVLREPLREALCHPEAAVRASAVRALSSLPAKMFTWNATSAELEPALALLDGMERDPDAEVREAVTGALKSYAELSPARTVPRLIAALAAGHSAAKAWLRDRRGEALADAVASPRAAALCASALQAEPARSEAIFEALCHEDGRARHVAAWMLWELVLLPNPPDLLKAFARPEPRVRRVAAAFLERVGSESPHYRHALGARLSFTAPPRRS